MVKTDFSKKQLTEAGIVAAILLLITGYYLKSNFGLVISLAILFISLIWPLLLFPFAVIWFNLSEVLGIVVSRIILSVIFFMIVVPTGMIRKIMGKDTLSLRKFKRDNQSVLKTRNHIYQAEDLIKPY